MYEENSHQPLQRIVFMGTPQFAVNVLEGLISSKYKVVLIVSQPDKPKGRDLVLEPTPVKQIALKHNIVCFQPEDVNAIESIDYIATFQPDLIFTLAYGAFLCRRLRSLPLYSAINLHPSLLPKHRGADPIRATLLSGDEDCGVSVFFLRSHMDSGRIVSRETFKVPDKANYTRLEAFLSEKSSSIALKAIELVSKNPKDFFPKQNDSQATYSNKVEKEYCIADFSLPCEVFMRRLRAFTDTPGYYCYLRGQRLKIFDAVLLEHQDNRNYGVIEDIIKNEGFVMSLPNGNVLIKEVQYSSKKRMTAWQFHIGARLQIGERLYNGV